MHEITTVWATEPATTHSHTMAKEYEDAIQDVGEFGRFQRIFFFIGNILSIGGCMCNLSYVFLAALPDHWCHVPSLHQWNLTLEEIKMVSLPQDTSHASMVYSRCEMYDYPYENMTLPEVLMILERNETAPVIGCQSGCGYDRSQYQSTISTEWDLTCDKKALGALSQSVYMAGMMVGVMFFGMFADAFGRRKAVIICIVINVVAAILATFSVNYIMFTALRFLIATSQISYATVFFVLSMEMVGPNWRLFVGIILEYTWVIGYFFVVAFAYGIRQWRHLQLAISLPLVSYFVLFFILPESPRWLYSKGRKEEADKQMKKIAECNKKTLPDKLDIIVKDSDSKVFIWKIFGFPRLRLRAIIMFYIWFVCSMVYYGLTLNTSNLGGNDYVNFLISGAIEIPAYIFCHLTLNRWGRRCTLIFNLLLGGVALIFTMAVPDDPQYHWVLITLTMTGKFGISAVFAIVYVYTAELFPTVVRSSGVGSSSFFARVGGIIAPQMGILGDISKYIPLVIFGALSLLAGLAALALPETVHRQLPETLQDAEDFSKNVNVCSCCPKVGHHEMEGEENPGFTEDTDTII